MTLCSCLACYDGAPALLQYDWMARQKEDEEEETAWGGPADEKERERNCLYPEHRKGSSWPVQLCFFLCLCRSFLKL